MVRSCSVKGCQSESYPGCGISFHGFPRDDEMRSKWIKAVPLKHTLTNYSSVCGIHFTSEDFTQTGLKNILKSDAIPSIFPVVVPLAKKVKVLSDILLKPATSSEPPTKKLRLEEYPVISITCEKRHEIEIIKIISSKFLTLRLRAYAKNETLKAKGHKGTMRQKLHKLITFSNV